MKLNPQTITLKKGNFKDACFYVVSVDHSFEITRLNHTCRVIFYFFLYQTKA